MKTLNIKLNSKFTFFNEQEDVCIDFYLNSGIIEHLGSALIDLCNTAMNFLQSGNYVEVHIEDNSLKTFAHLVHQDGYVENISPLSDEIIALFSSFSENQDNFKQSCDAYEVAQNEQQNALVEEPVQEPVEEPVQEPVEEPVNES